MACKETSETQGGECTLCAKRASASATHLLRGAPGFFCTADLEGDHGAAARPFPPTSAGYWPAAAPVYQRVHQRSCIDCRNAKTVPRKKKTADFTITQPTAALDRQGRPQRALAPPPAAPPIIICESKQRQSKDVLALRGGGGPEAAEGRRAGGALFV